MSENPEPEPVDTIAGRLGLPPQDLRSQFESVAGGTWSRRERLASHAREHRDDFVEAFGRIYSPDDVDALARSVVRTPDHLLVLPYAGSVQFAAVRLYPNESAMIAILRDGCLRTLYRATRYAVWRAHHPEASDVTDIYYKR